MVRGGGYDANLSPWTLTFFSPLTQGVRCDAYSLARLMTSLRLLVRFNLCRQNCSDLFAWQFWLCVRESLINVKSVLVSSVRAF